MSGIRVRRHTDGRVAVSVDGPTLAGKPFWHVIYLDGITCRSRENSEMSGDGWSELLVAQPPEPDHNCDGEDHEGNETIADQWEVRSLRDVDGIITAWTNGIEIEGVFYDAEDGGISDLERDALKLLAAIAEHRRCCKDAAEKYERARAEQGRQP